MRDNKLSSGDLLATRVVMLESAGTRSSRVDSKEASDQRAQHLTDENPQSTFKAKCTDLTAEYEGLNIGYVGGVRMPAKKSALPE